MWPPACEASTVVLQAGAAHLTGDAVGRHLRAQRSQLTHLDLPCLGAVEFFVA